MAWSDIPSVLLKAMHWFMGDQTSEQARLQRASDEAKAELSTSLRDGNVDRANAALDRMRELRDKAAATKRD